MSNNERIQEGPQAYCDAAAQRFEELKTAFPPQLRTLPKLLLRQAERYGARALFKSGDRIITFAQAPEVAARLAGVVPISPLADLRPLLRTSMNADLRLDMAEAEAESPMLMAERLDVPATGWVGADERPAFLDQARWLAEAWGCAHVVAEGRHHFDVIEPLEIADSDLTGALLG